METKHFDVLIIGSGSGSKITRPAASLGYSVAIVEKGPFGGTCLNRGCIPSKMLIHPADVMAEIEEANKFNITVSKPTIDKQKLVKRVCESIDKDSNSIEPLYAKIPNLTVYRGECKFTGTHTIEVNGVKVSADKIFIVAGCRANIPTIPGIEGTPYLTYAEALRLEEQPESMLVLGGGYIAVELGYYFGMTGTKVEFAVRSQMLSAVDKDIRQIFQDEFSKRFPVHLQIKPISVSYHDKKFHTKIQLKDGKVREFVTTHLLSAIGVVPVTDQLNLAAHGYDLQPDGSIKVDSSFRTNIPNVWAFGDIIGHPMFRHTANYQGEWVFKSVFKDTSLQDVGMAYPPIPAAVFSNPQIGTVGLTQEEAEAKYSKILIGTADYPDCAMGAALQVDHGMVKLIFAGDNYELVGAHIVGKEASTLIHILIAYMRCKANLDILKDTIYIHPALAEVVRNAVRDAVSNL
ncbi:hypothetical protein HDV06_005379 [Boothiomyces sp. JEL0866]|nr:hypothetical protein HDV06_005379 [Boothiomyces sp. JEL0866]